MGLGVGPIDRMERPSDGRKPRSHGRYPCRCCLSNNPQVGSANIRKVMKSPIRWWLVLFTAAFLAVLCFAIPMYVIRPFRSQGARELSLALAVMRIRPVLS